VSPLDDNDVLVMKTGMLFDEATIWVIASTLKKITWRNADPVCVSKSGHALLVGYAIEALNDGILSLVTLVTLNKFEAELIPLHKQSRA